MDSNILSIIFDIASGFFHALVFLMYINCLMEGRRFNNKFIYFIAYILMFGYRIALPYLFNSDYLTATTLLTTFLLTLLYKGQFGIRILVTVSFLGFGMFSEVCVVEIIKLLTGNSISMDSPDTFLYVGQGIVSVMLFLWVKIITVFKIRRTRKIPLTYYAMMIMLPAVSIISIHSLNLIPDNAFPDIIRILTSIALIYVNFVIFQLFDATLEKYELEERNRSLRRQVEYQASSYEKTAISFTNMRTLIHDTNRHLLYLRECAKNEDTKEIEEYINNVLNLMEKSYKRVSSGNPVIDALVSNASDLGEANKIRTQMDISHIQSDIGITRSDLCIVIGNILDNALEACRKISLPADRFLNVKIFSNDSALIIHVENSFATKPVRDKSGRFLTSKSDKQNHGIGIYSIEQIAKKYDGTVSINITENQFAITCILPFIQKESAIKL